MCRSIQYHLDSTARHTADSSSSRFAKFMMEEKLCAATRLIDDNASIFPLSLNTSVTIYGVTSADRDIIVEKHPSSHLPRLSVLFLSPSDLSPPPFHRVIF